MVVVSIGKFVCGVTRKVTVGNWSVVLIKNKKWQVSSFTSDVTDEQTFNSRIRKIIKSVGPFVVSNDFKNTYSRFISNLLINLDAFMGDDGNIIVIKDFDGTPALSDIEFMVDPNVNVFDYVTVNVDSNKVDTYWKKDKSMYVGVNGIGGVKSRYSDFKKFLNVGERIEQSILGIDRKGLPSFVNGRHRFAVLRDIGMKKIPVSVHKDQVKQITELFA